jgi:hypothetical protein
MGDDNNKAYKRYLTQFMSFRGGLLYGDEYEFTPEELAEITPNQLVQWMSVKVFGVANPGPEDHPTLGRSTSLEFYEKAISSFMPHRITPWNSITNFGNPTRSVEVNDLIKRVRKKEVRKQGKASQARRALEPEEFEQLIAIIEENADNNRYALSALNRFQFHMIARIDDTAKFYVEDLKANTQFDFTLLAKMCWSKNVQDERDAPDQIVMGAMDRRYCVLLGMAAHLETWIESGDGATNPFVFGFGGEEDPLRNKAKAKHFLKAQVFSNPEFITGPGEVGSHSIRKYAATYARRNGCPRDDTDGRGRWKKRKRQVDTYIEPTLPYPDARVAAVLCRGGACKYVVKAGSGISDDWILEYVVPHIRMRFSRSVALVLGRALLWAVFEDFGVYLPIALRNRIQTAYADIPGRQLVAGENPVKRVPLVVSGNEGEVYIDELAGDDDDDDGERPRRRARYERNELLGLHSQVTLLRQENVQLRAQGERQSNRSDEQFATLGRLMRRLLGQAARPIMNVITGEPAVAAAGEAAPLALPLAAPVVAATLSSLPRTLHALWIEYEFGTGGKKPAKDFTAAERGRCKYTYHRRKVVWDVVALHVRSGWLADLACDRIYDVYGRGQSVTSIINNMRKDRATYNGVHPALRIANL